MAITKTYRPLQTLTLSGSATSVTFSNIPNSYSDLILIYNGTTTANIGVSATLNGDTANQQRTFMYGSGGTKDGGTGGPREVIYSSTTMTTAIVEFLDYSATDKHKMILCRSGAAGVITLASINTWQSLTALNSISISPNSGSFSLNSTFSLYGVIA